jgi:hypothetical protein
MLGKLKTISVWILSFDLGMFGHRAVSLFEVMP